LRKNKTDAYYSCPSRKYHGKGVCVPNPVSIGGATLNSQIFELLQKQTAIFAEQREYQAKIAVSESTNTELLQTKQELGRVSGF
jgi:hypothetical protein